VGWLGALAAVAALPFAWLLVQVSAAVMRVFFLEPAEQSAVTTLQNSSHSWQYVLMGFMAVVVAPAAEEVLFRGLLYPYLKQRTRPWVAVLWSSVLFGAIHMNLVTFLPLTLLAVLLVWLYEATGNLLAPVIAHAVFNLANLLLLLLVSTQ
jgi:membrane protease YdiL (CAAX protease family)